MAETDHTWEEDVPPLEDMSDLLAQVDKIRDTRGPPVTKEANTSHEKQSKQAVAVERQLSSDKNPRKATKEDTFGGFKKGFLFGTPEKKKVKACDNIPYIKPESHATEDTKYRFPEVQDAMKLGQSFAENKDWVTDGLLKQIQKSEIIMKKMNDPRFMQAMQEFQTNPGAALTKHAGDKDMESFLKEFCSILGTHFENFTEPKKKDSSTADKSDILTSHSSAADISARGSISSVSGDEKKIQEILNDPEMRKILLDVRIQKLLETLRTDPDKAQRVLKDGGADIQIKIKKLVDAGVLGFQR